MCAAFCYCLLWPNRCIETIYVCIWRMFVFMSVVVIVWGSVGMFVFGLGVLKYVVCLCKGVMDVVFLFVL